MAKEVPIDIVAGSAGGTTMVTKSRARIMITGHEIYPARHKGSFEGVFFVEHGCETYTKLDEIVRTGQEPNYSNNRQYPNKSKRIAIERKSDARERLGSRKYSSSRE